MPTANHFEPIEMKTCSPGGGLPGACRRPLSVQAIGVKPDGSFPLCFLLACFALCSSLYLRVQVILLFQVT